MRIISQLEMDFPYEQIVVIVNENRVICRPISDMGGRYYLLGHYYTEERAQEVFKEIQRTYKTCDINFIVYVMPEE